MKVILLRHNQLRPLLGEASTHVVKRRYLSAHISTEPPSHAPSIYCYSRADIPLISNVNYPALQKYNFLFRTRGLVIKRTKAAKQDRLG